MRTGHCLAIHVTSTLLTICISLAVPLWMRWKETKLSDPRIMFVTLVVYGLGMYWFGYWMAGGFG